MMPRTGPANSQHWEDAVAAAYPPLLPLLRRLLTAVRPLLGPQFVGLYLHGSLAAGAFDPERSDVDFVAATARRLPEAVLPRLAAQHESLFRSGLPLATRLEGSYIPVAALCRYDPQQSHHPALRIDGTLAVDFHGRDWVLQNHVLRRQGLVLAGPPPETLIDPVTPDELRHAARFTLDEWWAKQVDNREWLSPPEYQVYAVLTMCRAWYTVAHGDVAGKPTAARWTRDVVAPRWVPLINRALAWRPGEPFAALDEVSAFIRYTLANI